jgi:hypothetical protein
LDRPVPAVRIYPDRPWTAGTPGRQNERGGPRETSLRPGGPGGPLSLGLTYVSILLCDAHHDRPIDAIRKALLSNRPFKSIVETFAQSDRPWTAGPRGPGVPARGDGAVRLGRTG